MAEYYNKIDAIMLLGNAYCRLNRLPEATVQWKVAYVYGKGHTDSYLLRLRKNIYTALMDATNVMLMNLYIPADDDNIICDNVLDQLLKMYVHFDANNRKEASIVLQNLIDKGDSVLKNNPCASGLDMRFPLYLLKALCSKHIIPYEQKNVCAALNDLKKYLKPSNINAETTYKAMFTLCQETGQITILNRLFNKAKALLGEKDQDNTFHAALSLLNANYEFSRGSYKLALKGIEKALSMIEPLYLKAKVDLSAQLEQWDNVVQAQLEKSKGHHQDLHQYWADLLTLLRGYLTGEIDHDSYHQANERYLQEHTIPKEHELELFSFHKRYVVLVDLDKTYVYSNYQEKDEFCDSFEKFVGASQLYLQALTSAVHYYMNTGNAKETSRYLKQAFDLKVPDYSLYISRGTIWLKKGRLKDALIYFNKAVALAHPWLTNAAGTYVERGYFYTHTYEYEKARKDLEIAEHMAPGLSTVHLEWGRLYTRLDNEELAMESFKLAETINSHDVKLYTTRAACHMEFDNYDKALKDLIEAKKRNPRSFAYLCNAARLLIITGLNAEAKQLAEKAVEEDACDCRSRLLLARLALEADNDNEVVHQIHNAQKINPSDSRIFVFFAKLLLKGKKDILKTLLEDQDAYPHSCIKANYFLYNILKNINSVKAHNFARVSKAFSTIRTISPHKTLLWQLEAFLAKHAFGKGAFEFYLKNFDQYKNERRFYALCKDLIDENSDEYHNLEESIKLFISQMKEKAKILDNDLSAIKGQCKQYLCLSESPQCNSSQ